MIGVSLFAGAGGMDQGACQAGLTTIAAVEIDEIACNTFEKNFPGTTLFRMRVESMDWSKFDQHFPGVDVDVVFGGPPCQPFSVAGKGRGQYDERDGAPHYMAVIAALKPRAFVLENVRGLTFATHRRYLQQVCEDFRALGYDVFDRVLDAADYGVPQHRERLFIVGLRSDQFGGFTFRWPVATHADPKALQDHLFGDDLRQPWITVRQALGLGPGMQQRKRGDSQVRPDHTLDEPAMTVTDESAGGSHSGLRIIHGGLLDRPSTSVMAAAQGRLPPPGHHSSIFDNAREKDQRTEEARKDQEVFDAAIEKANEILLRDQWGENGKAHSPTYDGDRPSRTLTRHPQQLALSNGVGRADPIDLDEPSRSVLARMYKEPKDLTRWVDAKHPPSQLDEPAKTISSGGDGHSAHDHVLEDSDEKPARTLTPSQDGCTRLRSQRIEDGTLSPEEAYGRSAGGLHKGERVLDADAPSPALQGDGGQDFVGPLPQSQRVMDPEMPASTMSLNRDARVPGQQQGKHGRYRRLTVEECAKLQAFPSSFQFAGTKSAQYRQVGNAVPPPLARAVVAAVITALGADAHEPSRPDGRSRAARPGSRERR